MKLIVCLDTPTASASSCWVIFLMALSTFTLFFILHPPDLYHFIIELADVHDEANKHRGECEVHECQVINKENCNQQTKHADLIHRVSHCHSEPLTCAGNIKRKESRHIDCEPVGITQANLSILKIGKAKAVRFSTLSDLCKALNCQPGDLLEYQPGDEDDSDE